MLRPYLTAVADAISNRNSDGLRSRATSHPEGHLTLDIYSTKRILSYKYLPVQYMAAGVFCGISEKYFCYPEVPYMRIYYHRDANTGERRTADRILRKENRDNER